MLMMDDASPPLRDDRLTRGIRKIDFQLDLVSECESRHLVEESGLDHFDQ